MTASFHNNAESKAFPFALIVAMDLDNGIGKSGKLPWHIPGELKHFREITMTTADQTKKNAVIMGRKTWESLPEKFRPLPGRLNIVLSRDPNIAVSSGVKKAKSLQEALLYLSQDTVRKSIEKIFIIGGSQVFKEALEDLSCQTLYITFIQRHFECDTFFPKIPSFFRETKRSGKITEDSLSYYFSEFRRS